MIQTLLQVALGGALGASSRYLTGVAVTALLGRGFPWGTLTVNILGSFAMGLLITVLGSLSATRLHPLLAVGFLGGFTTFSSFSLDVATLYERGDIALAAGYAAVSVVASILALFLGLALARSFFA
ncbi:putative fluoride ion transporter CrcB [Salipiger pallidus]|uniref:Fluoride-specific ion channel FluC n=1 Tax=Salipiger pallidus TaxID=1775170 RepID=A0A8J2ZHU8_9RHOB|nr:fluoride efflux transporter CrcB [Salipiger pallidus]GGG64741.1 putative fluoride ion transporter CrcB [Salipiger pallidus]